jgi:hypothetical protein
MKRESKRIAPTAGEGPLRDRLRMASRQPSRVIYSRRPHESRSVEEPCHPVTAIGRGWISESCVRSVATPSDRDWLQTGPERRLALGRRRACDQAGVAIPPRPVAYLVRFGFYPAVLSAAAQRVLGRAQVVGRCSVALSPHQRPAARDGGLSGGIDRKAPVVAWSLAGGLCFRAAPGVRWRLWRGSPSR